MADKEALIREVILAIRDQSADEQELTKKLDCDPVAFLGQYGSHIPVDSLSYFNSSDNPAVWRIRQQLVRRHRERNAHSEAKSIRNRRYTRMMQLAQETDYFSLEKMKERNPLLYHQYIGRYDEKLDRMPRKLSEQLLFLQDQDRIDNQRKVDATVEYDELNLEEGRKQQDKAPKKMTKDDDEEDEDEVEGDEEDEEGDEVEEDEEDEEDEEEDGEKSESKEKKSGEMPWNHEVIKMDAKSRARYEGQPVFTINGPKISSEERDYLAKEFMRLMQVSFLEGKDGDVDYGKIDQDRGLDDTHQMQQDSEDKYFDEQEEDSPDDERNYADDGFDDY